MKSAPVRPVGARDRTGHVITVAQQKGGTGKTTLTVHLAIAWLQLGKSVALIDLDPQASLTRWYRHRFAHFGKTEGLTHRQTSGWRVATEIEALRRDHDLILLDNPPHADTELKIAIRGSDLLLVPLQLSPTDFWAMRSTLDIAAAEGTSVVLVYNRVPPRGRLLKQIRDQIETDDLSVAETQLGNRIAFAASLMAGQGVTEFARRSPAAAEIWDLTDELLSRLGLPEIHMTRHWRPSSSGAAHGRAQVH